MSKGVDFFFFFWEGDQHLVLNLVGMIRRWYSESRIVATSDGPVDTELVSQLNAMIGITAICNPERLKLPGRCEDHLIRGFSQALSATTAPTLIQVDPDSEIRRQAFMPDPCTDWIGQVFYQPEARILSTTGAGVAFSRLLLIRLAAYLERLPSSERQNFFYKGDQVSEDSVIGYHLSKLGYCPLPWLNADGFPEVELWPQWNPSLEAGDWAITHPKMPEPVIS